VLVALVSRGLWPLAGAVHVCVLGVGGGGAEKDSYKLFLCGNPERVMRIFQNSIKFVGGS